jgi:predicted CopG family antitoxin
MKQHKVISMKEENESISSITKTLGIKRKEANEILSFAKDRLEFWVEQTSKNDGIPMTYNDMIEYFTSK